MSEEQAKHQCYLSAHDLKIGNWVYDGKNIKFPMQVVAIGKDWVYLDFPCNEGGVWEESPKELQPIPLTAEFFKKNGFILQEDFGYDFKYFTNNDMRICVCESSNGWAVHIDGKECFYAFGMCLKYVHELQNAYYISNRKELEVKLW